MSFNTPIDSGFFSPIRGFFSGFAESFGRAQRAQDIINRSDSYFQRRGTTQEKAVRRVFDI